MTLNRTFIVALMCGTFVSAAPAFAGGILGGGIGGGGALNVPVVSGRADVGADAHVDTRGTVVGTVATLRGAADAAKGSAHSGVRIVKHAADEGAARVEETGESVVSEAEAKVNVEAMASASSDVSGTLSTVGKANAEAEGDAWFDIF
jgi:hypothetical protein